MPCMKGLAAGSTAQQLCVCKSKVVRQVQREISCQTNMYLRMAKDIQAQRLSSRQLC